MDKSANGPARCRQVQRHHLSALNSHGKSPPRTINSLSLDKYTRTRIICQSQFPKVKAMDLKPRSHLASLVSTQYNGMQHC